MLGEMYQLDDDQSFITKPDMVLVAYVVMFVRLATHATVWGKWHVRVATLK